MHPRSPNELDQFKCRINFTEYVATQGYEMDHKASSRHSVVMRGPGEDKIVIAINADTGHWIYFSVRDETDNGTIVDFIQKRQQLSLGEVRKALRPWIGLGSNPPKRPPESMYAAKVEPGSSNLARVAAEYARMIPVEGHHPYLEEERRIPSRILSDPRFTGKIKTDDHGNAVFPHHNANGPCGYELKNRHFTGFAKGGEKGIWASAANSSDSALVIVESAIDALSYHAIHKPPATRYISIGGAMNLEQPGLIQRAITRLPNGGRLIIATDNDAAGDALAERIKALRGAAQRPDIDVREDRPPDRGQDWNDRLKSLARS